MKKHLKTAGNVFIVIVICVLVFCCIPGRDGIIANVIDTFTYKEIEFTEQTKEQMLSDFDYMLDVLKAGIPNISESEKLYGFDFDEKCAKYREMAEKCENGFDFYVLCNAVLADIPNCHTYMSYMQSSYIASQMCFNAEHVRFRPNIGGIADAWNKYLGEKTEPLYDRDNSALFLYCDGHYMNIEYEKPELREKFGQEILEINGRPVSEFVNENLFYSKLSYDFKNNIPYRDNITFNLTDGEELDALVLCDDGTTKNIKIFYSLERETAFNEASAYAALSDYDFEEAMQEVDEESYTLIYTEDTDTLYAEFTSFDYFDGEKLKSEMEKYAECRHIIFDVRENGGGITGFWEKNIYAPLFKDKLIIDNESYLELNKYNCNPFGDLLESLYYSHEKLTARELPFETDSAYSWYKFNEYDEYDGEYDGETAVEDRDIYILSGRNSASLTDEFIYYFSKNGLATIVGENTKGEGIAPTFMCQAMPETGLVFNYSPFIAFNSDGKDNSVYCSAPDIYVTLTCDDYVINRQLRMEGKNTLDYENRLLWDTELKYVLSLIEADVDDMPAVAA